MTGKRYPGYDVLSKFSGVSWNDASRRTIERRLATSRVPRFFDTAQWQTLLAVCECIVPQPKDRAAVPIAALLDERLSTGRTDGFRRASMPEQDEAWRRGLRALEAEAQAAHGQPFHELPRRQQQSLLERMQSGELKGPAWGDMSSKGFFEHRVVHDLVSAYYSHPTPWSEIGWGGPASPRGYVRMQPDRRDPWEAAEARPGHESEALKDNVRIR